MTIQNYDHEIEKRYHPENFEDEPKIKTEMKKVTYFKTKTKGGLPLELSYVTKVSTRK